MTTATARRRPDWSALAAGLIAFAVDAAYVAVLSSEGEGDLHGARAQLIAASIVAAGALALGAWTVAEPRVRLALTTAAAFTLLAWGFLGLFSIGLPLFLGGILLLFSVGRAAAFVDGTEAFMVVGFSASLAVCVAAAIVATTT